MEAAAKYAPQVAASYRETRAVIKGNAPGGASAADLRMNRHRALALCLRMIFSENRHPFFGIMR
jgi:hypothetical protein